MASFAKRFPQLKTVPTSLSMSQAKQEQLAHVNSLKRLLIRCRGRVFFVPTESIQWIEADLHFVRLHLTGGQSHKIRTAMSALYEKLDRHQFLRVSRSAIVNFDFVSEMRSRNRSDYEVLLRDGNGGRLRATGQLLSFQSRNGLSPCSGPVASSRGRSLTMTRLTPASARWMSMTTGQRATRLWFGRR
jgi:LytTr DNA-binding domain